MVRSLKFAARLMILVAGLMAIAFAISRWFWFHHLPRFASARFCGNCFLATVGVPTELGLLGILLISSLPMSRSPWRWRSLVDWLLVAAGICFTPEVLGVPVFLFGLSRLIASSAQQPVGTHL